MSKSASETNEVNTGDLNPIDVVEDDGVVALRRMTADDLPLIPGGDSEFDDFAHKADGRVEVSQFVPHYDGGLVVIDTDSGEVLGDVSWHWVGWGPNAESRNPMIGIWLRPEARGHGVGVRAQKLLVDYLFASLDINRIEAHTDVENKAESKALKRAGFTREGVVRGGQFRQGEFHDGYLYSIVRSEWKQTKK